jgi:hypothetical protein
MKVVRLLWCALASVAAGPSSRIPTTNETELASSEENGPDRRVLKASSSLDFLAQAMLLSPGKTPQARVRVDGRGSSTSKVAHSAAAAATATKAHAERQEAIALAEGIGGPLMLRLAEGLKATAATLAELEARVAGSASTSFGPGFVGGSSSDGAIDVAKVFAQGVGFQSDEARARLVDKVALELLAEKPSERRFVVGVMGTSVTAGHDNWFNESWAQVLGAWLAPTFAAAGVSVEVRNHAIGGNRYETSAYCARATVGEDVDAFFFEFNMIFHGPGTRL